MCSLHSPIGAASYPDFTNPQMRAWWANMFSYDNYEVREALPYPLATVGCLAVALAQDLGALTFMYLPLYPPSLPCLVRAPILTCTSGMT